MHLLLVNIIFLSVVSAIFIFVKSRKSLNNGTRESVKGEYISLSDGVTHFQLKGNIHGETIVLVPGITHPSYIWNHIYDRLVARGFRVLRYDLFGRGFSDKPKIKYNVRTNVRQLDELISHLHIAKPFTLVGLSVGCDTAVAYLNLRERLVKNLCLISPIAKTNHRSIRERIILFPFIGKIIMTLLGDYILLERNKTNLYHPEKFPEFQPLFSKQMKIKGYKQAIHSTLKHLPTDIEQTYNSYPSLQKPTCIIMGAADNIDHSPENEKILRIIPHQQCHIIPDAGHDPQYEQGERVSQIIADFVK